MNQKQAKRSRRNEGYYKEQFRRTEANKIRRLQRMVNRFPKYRALGYKVTNGVVSRP